MSSPMIEFKLADQNNPGGVSSIIGTRIFVKSKPRRGFINNRNTNFC
jgi:hypothetical protein